MFCRFSFPEVAWIKPPTDRRDIGAFFFFRITHCGLTGCPFVLYCMSLNVCFTFFLAVQLLKSVDLGRHSLLYIKEIGHGWFGKVSTVKK